MTLVVDSRPHPAPRRGAPGLLVTTERLLRSRDFGSLSGSLPCACPLGHCLLVLVGVVVAAHLAMEGHQKNLTVVPHPETFLPGLQMF